MNEKEFINFRQLWRYFWQNKKSIIIISTVGAIIVLVISFILPKTYTAEAVLIMPESISGGLGISSPFGMIGQGLSAEQGFSSQTIKTLIKSKRCRKKIIKRFSLVNKYGVKSTGEALKILEERIRVGILSMKGELRIQYEDQNPERAAKICNTCIYMLDTLNNEINIAGVKDFVKVVDYASIPKTFSSPKIKLNTVSAFLLFFIISIAYYAIKDKSK